MINNKTLKINKLKNIKIIQKMNIANNPDKTQT